MSETNHAPLLTGCEPLCGWRWFRWSKENFTQADFDRLGMEVSIDGRDLPALSASNNKDKYRENMQVVRSYQKGDSH